MNLFTIIALTTMLSGTTATPDDQPKFSYEKLYSASTYPYDLLLRRVETVKLYYSISEQKVTCAVLLEDQALKLKSDYVVVDKKKFDAKPFASCLARKEAKNWLKQTF